MEQSPRKLHPLIMVAAVSVTAASLAAIGVMTGIVPARKAEAPENAVVAAAAPATQPSAAAPAEKAGAEPPAATTPAPAPAATSAKTNHSPAPAKKTASAVPAPPVGAPPPAPTGTAAIPAPPPPLTPPAPPPCRDCGTVESVRAITVKGEGTGLGAVAGGIIGGVLGHQVGSGRGNDLATVAGAVGGAVAGHQIEKQQRRTTRHEILVRMDDGSLRTFTSETQPSWHAGDRVRIADGGIAPLM